MTVKTDEATAAELKSLVASSEKGGAETSQTLEKLATRWEEVLASPRYAKGRQTAYAMAYLFGKLKAPMLAYAVHTQVGLKFNNRHATGMLLGFSSRSDLPGFVRTAALMHEHKLRFFGLDYLFVAKVVRRAGAPADFLLKCIAEAKRKGDLDKPKMLGMYKEAVKGCVTPGELDAVSAQARSEGYETDGVSYMRACRAARNLGLAREYVEREGLQPHSYGYNFYALVHIVTGEFEFAREYLQQSAARPGFESLVKLYLTTTRARVERRDDAWVHFSADVFRVGLEHRACGIEAWGIMMSIHAKERNVEACEDLIAEYTQQHGELPDKLRLAYIDACAIHFEDCAGPFGVDAASKEQLAEWKKRTCPPHATPSNVLGV
ncbi:hypothetical protein DIPPA_35926 [Diplonema papillatum]|nr:hypothetical protein DIPPA_35926 [Diplonema papillatum]